MVAMLAVDVVEAFRGDPASAISAKIMHRRGADELHEGGSPSPCATSRIAAPALAWSSLNDGRALDQRQGPADRGIAQARHSRYPASAAPRYSAAHVDEHQSLSLVRTLSLPERFFGDLWRPRNG